MIRKSMAMPGTYSILPAEISRVIAADKKNNEETRLQVKETINYLLKEASSALGCEKPAFTLQEYTRCKDKQRMAVFEADERAKKLGLKTIRIEMPFPLGENTQNPLYPNHGYPGSTWWLIQAEVAKHLTPLIKGR